MIKKVKKGFTLIELLIVVSIIGILSVALVPSITDAPKRARDAARKTMVNTVVAAVESYNLDKGNYPAGTFCVDGDGSATVDETGLIALIGGNAAPKSSSVDTSITTVEIAPCTNASNTFVSYSKTTTGYTVAIKLELAGKGTHACTSATPMVCTTAGSLDYFAVVR